MNPHRYIAEVLTVVVAVLVGLGLNAPSAGFLAAIILLPTFAAMTTFAALTGRHAEPTRQHKRRAATVAARAAGITATVLSAVGGLAKLLGAATAPVLIVAGIIATPWAWSRARHHVDQVIARLLISRRTASDSDPPRRDGQDA